MPPDEQKTESNDGNVETTPKNPIATSINRALHRCRDIEAVARLMVPFSADMQQNMWEAAHDALKKAEVTLDHDEGNGADISETDAAELDDAFLCVDRLGEADLPSTLLTSLFLGLFSAYDAFTGNLLQALYQKRPQLLESLNIQITLSEILKHNSLDELKEALLLDEIETFRRKSYVEQFEQLESRFSLMLRKFSHWPDFVEVGQRRNLITHCDGSVSKQYLKICAANGCTIPDSIREGSILEIDLDYLHSACSVVYEVILKLGQTLWRKLFPDEANQANEHLTETTYEALRMERWRRAILLSEFATSQHQPVRDLDRRIRLINHAIALKFSGDLKGCAALLESEDWSAALPEFALGNAVLSEKFQDAAALMKQIGKKGQIISQKAYHVWPLFREFRRSETFLASYSEIYGTTFAKEALETAGKAPEGLTAPEKEGSPRSEQKFKPPLEVIRKIIG